MTRMLFLITPVALAFDFAGCWKRAAQLADIKEETIWRAMGGMSKGQGSSAVHGVGSLDFRRLLMAVQDDPDVARFFQQLQLELAAAMQMERDTPQTLLRRALALLDRPRMVKVDSATRNTERKTA